MSLYEDLMYRGLIKDVASPDLKKVLDGENYLEVETPLLNTTTSF